MNANQSRSKIECEVDKNSYGLFCVRINNICKINRIIVLLMYESYCFSRRLRWSGLSRPFFSKEEPRIHIHVISPDGEAKFWVEPIIALANYTGFSKKQLNLLQKTVERHKNEIIKKWQKHLQCRNY